MIHLLTNIATELELIGWKVVRYAKPGVTNNHIDFDVYKQTDLKNIGQQLQQIWGSIPTNKPRLIFAWSEGSLHVPLLPLEQADGVIILGGISTNISDIILWQVGGNKEKMDSLLQELEKMPREQMLGLDRPAGRLIDELSLADNWSRFDKLGLAPMLILHGQADKEVPLSQASVWQNKLGNERVTLVTKNGKNHMLGDNDADGASTIASEINNWWLKLAK
jgi:hypothetical protein